MDVSDLSTSQMAMGIGGAATACGVLGGAYVLAAYALPVPVIGGTVVSAGLLYAGLKDTDLMSSDKDTKDTKTAPEAEAVTELTA